MARADIHDIEADRREKLKSWNTALIPYRKALKLMPGNPEYHRKPGCFYWRFGLAMRAPDFKLSFFQKALSSLDMAKKLSPMDWRTWVALAEVTDNLKRLDKRGDGALDPGPLYRRALELAPNDASLHYRAACFYWREGAQETARKHIGMLARYDPGLAVHYVIRSKFWKSAGVNVAVNNGLRQALNNQFTRRHAASVLASRLAGVGKWLDAARVYEKAELKPGPMVDMSHYYQRLGTYYLGAGEYKAARLQFLNGLSSTKNKNKFLEQLEWRYQRDKAFVEFDSLLDSVQERHPGLDEVEFYRARNFYAKGFYGKALDHLKEFLSRKETPEGFYWMARIQEKLNEPYRAEAYIKKAIEAEPERAGYHNYYAKLLYDQWRLGEALAESEKATKLEGKNPWYHDQRAWILYRNKDYQAAAHAWEDAVNLKPDHKGLRKNLDRALVMIEKVAQNK